MVRRHAIDVALDLSRMPAIARSSLGRPLPADIAELMQVAARQPKACQDAASATGEPADALVEAARFYLQQQLFQPAADCYRILGLERGASRATAREHMRWLLEWLHPDRNNGLEAVYAERVLEAWREVSAQQGSDESEERQRARAGMNGHAAASLRLPWIKLPTAEAGIAEGRYSALAAWFIPAAVAIVLLTLWSAIHFFDAVQTTVVSRMP